MSENPAMTTTQVVVQHARNLHVQVIKRELAELPDNLARQIEAQVAAGDFVAAFETCTEGIARWSALGRRLAAVDWSYTAVSDR